MALDDLQLETASVSLGKTLGAAPSDAQSNGSAQVADRAGPLDPSSLDTTAIPRSYLDAYPHPAFVLIVPLTPLSHDTSEAQLTDVSYEPIWANQHWRKLARGRSLRNCLSADSWWELVNWSAGVEDPNLRRLLATPEVGARRPEPAGDDIDIENDFAEDDGPGLSPTLTLEFAFAGDHDKLKLSKASLPIHQRSFQRTLVRTHTFAIVTSMPAGGRTRRRASVSPARNSEPPTRKGSRALENARRRTTPWNDMNPSGTPVNVLESIGKFEPGKPLYFFRDGTISHGPPARWPSLAKSPDDVATLMESTNWAATPLGPREQWTPLFKTSMAMLLGYPIPACVCWGEELTIVYNQMWADRVANHPQAFARPASESWPEVWGSLTQLDDVVLSGTPIFSEDDLFRCKWEKYRTGMWLPIKDGDNQVRGYFHNFYDTTGRVLSERRAIMLREMGERMSLGPSLEEFDEALLGTFEDNPRDVPFALLFHVEASKSKGAEARKLGSRAGSFSRGTESTKVRLRYAGGVGVPAGHPSAPETCSFDIPGGTQPTSVMMATSFTALDATPSKTPKPKPPYTPVRTALFNTSNLTNSSFRYDSDKPEPAEEWPLVEVLRTRRSIVVRDCSKIIEGYQVRVWEQLPTSAVIIPIMSTGGVQSAAEDGELPGAVVILGLSSRLPFDLEYQAFLRAMRIQLAPQLAAALAYEDDVKRRAELEDLDRTKSLLFSNVSHELVTPLSLISGPIDDVLADLPPGRHREELSMARRNVERLSRLVGMLGDLGSLEAGVVTSLFHRVNLGEVTRNVATMFRHASDDSQFTFTVQCDMDSKDVYIDTDKYEKILFTLIGNALRFTMSGTIQVTVHYEDSEAVLTVKTTGVAIPSPRVERPRFGKEYMDDDLFSHGHEVSGILLTYTAKLVQLHHGTFRIQSSATDESSDDERGTEFIVRLPLGSSHLPPYRVQPHHSSDETPLQQFHKSVLDEIPPDHWGVPPEKKDAWSLADPISRGIDPSTLNFESEDVVLLVDSFYDTRRYMRSIFGPFCKVVEASDGYEALDMVEKHHPNLIIADVMLPKMSGFALLKALKTGTKEQQMVPIILLTSMQDAKADGAYGADDYLPKPFNAREFISRAHMQLQMGKKRRALESAFEERTHELRLLTEHSPVGIFRCTAEGFVTYANQAWYEVSGYPDGPVTNWGDYVDPGYQDHVSQVWMNYVARQAIHERAEWPWRNGRWVSATVIRLNSPGAPANIIGCTVDITERKVNERMQREQVHAAEERRAAAEEARRQQELLIDITSHEIRNPISSLMQCASLVKSNLLVLKEQMESALEGGEPIIPTDQLLVTMGEDLEALDSIYQCGLTQERISNDVLSLGKIQLDMLQMYDVETNILKEVQKLIFVFQNEARMKRLDLQLVWSDAFASLGIERIMTDPVRMGQIVTNLLSNAIRFTANSAVRRVELRVDVGLEPPSDGSCAKPPSSAESSPSSPIANDTPLYLYVTVADTGPGLTPSELDTLFQRFCQASPETHTVYGGSGLGLYVCRQLAQRMGGHIDVTSEVGEGSQFRFYIKTRAVAPADGAADARTGSVKSGRARSETPVKKSHILVVEDNFINRTVLIRQLQHVGLTVEAASNGLEALERLRQVQGVPTRSETMPPLSTNVPIGQDPLHRPGLNHLRSKSTPTTTLSTSPPSLDSPLSADSDPGAKSYSPPPHGSGGAGGSPRRFDCVLMDLEMPVMDGYTSVRLLREDERAGRLVPSNVVALTGNARQAQITEAMADFTDVVVKPYRLDDLLRTIEKSIAKHGGVPSAGVEEGRE